MLFVISSQAFLIMEKYLEKPFNCVKTRGTGCQLIG